MALLQVVHWLVNGIPRCGDQELNPAGVTVSHSFDTNQLHVTCGLCCAYLVNENMGASLRDIYDRQGGMNRG